MKTNRSATLAVAAAAGVLALVVLAIGVPGLPVKGVLGGAWGTHQPTGGTAPSGCCFNALSGNASQTSTGAAA